MNRVEIKEQAKKRIQGNFWTLWKGNLIIIVSLYILNFLIVFISGYMSAAFFGASEFTSNMSIVSFIPIFLLITLILLIGIEAPLMVGLLKYQLNFVRGKNCSIKTIFQNYNRIIIIFLVYGLVMIFSYLWALLLIIPGIIAALSYSQAFYILADQEQEQNENPLKIIQKSKEMMMGHKMDLFIFQLSFIGWMILSVLTFGIALIYVLPYYQISLALFYEELIKKA